MLEKIHIIGLGLMGTNLGIKLVNSGSKVSGSDITEKNEGAQKSSVLFRWIMKNQ